MNKRLSGSVHVRQTQSQTRHRHCEARSKLESDPIALFSTIANFYSGFQAKTDQVKSDFLAFLPEAKHQGKTLSAYGAVAKDNTLLNYAGVRPDLWPSVIDHNPARQDKFLPACRIPIVAEEQLKQARPDHVVICIKRGRQMKPTKQHGRRCGMAGADDAAAKCWCVKRGLFPFSRRPIDERLHQCGHHICYVFQNEICL